VPADWLRGELEGPGNGVVVEVQNGVVILEGLVATRALHDLLHRLVWRVPGVADVCNRLTTWEDERRRQAGS
jgi:osmotically-inducible protein OsmY